MITITLALEHPLALTDIQYIGFQGATELTIASGAITVTQTHHTVDTESDAATDDLDTINGHGGPRLIYLRAEHTDRTVVIKHNTGNILTTTGSDYSLSDTNKVANFLYDTSDSKWHMIVAVAAAGAVAGSDTQVQFNDGGSAFGADAGLTYNKTNDRLDITRTAIGASQGDYGLKLTNTTAALTGERIQLSPPAIWQGYGWETDVGSSMAVAFRAFARPVTGAAAPIGGLDFQASIDGGAFVPVISFYSSAPSASITNGFIVWSADRGGTAGKAGLHLRSEDGTSHVFSDFVGLGTLTPDTILHLAHTTPTITLDDTDVSAHGFVAFGTDLLLLAANRNPISAVFSDTGAASSDMRFYAANADSYVAIRTGSVNNTTPTERVRIIKDGKVGIGTTAPSKILDCNDGSGNMIADGYDSHPSIHALKENAVAITGAGMIDRLKSFKLFEFTRRPYVSADELRTAAIKHFSPGHWVEAFGGQVVEDEDGTKRVEGDDYHAGKLYECPDEGMLAFLDSTAEKLRVKRRKLPEWQRKHLGFIIDDPGTEEALGDVIHYDETGETTGYSLNDYVGFLHGVALETITRLEALEAR